MYVVWLPILATDSRGEWNASVFEDPRVRDYWDEQRVVGRWFAERDVGGLGYAGIVWDAYFYYGPGDTLLAPAESGSPVIDATEPLEAAFT